MIAHTVTFKDSDGNSRGNVERNTSFEILTTVITSRNGNEFSEIHEKKVLAFKNKFCILAFAYKMFASENISFRRDCICVKVCISV